MTKHMVRFYIEPPKGEAENAVDNWVSNHNEWEEDPTSHTVSEVEDAGGTSYVMGNYRFHQDGTASDLLDDFEDKISSIQGGLWYRVAYHVCDHDEGSLTACSWEMTREGGTIPSGVPKF